MQLTLASLALVAASAVSAQGVSGVLLPPTSAPAGCVADYSGQFEITAVLPPKKRDLQQIERRDACGSTAAVLTLKGGILTDAKGRIGAIVANHQFQFDGPPAQTGSLYTGGWSVCKNGSLAIGGSAVFYECNSGSLNNLYDQSIGAQCYPIEIDVIPCGSSGVAQSTDGQVVATSAGAKVTQITDGQVQATSAGAKVTQISDGQIQATSAVSRKPISQYTDGQLQVPTGTQKPVTQISDGQVQAPTPTTKKSPITQISDGQIQAPSTLTKAPITQISDGQIQAPTTLPGAKVTQISDGQIQAPNATSTRARVTANAAAVATFGAQLIAGAAAAAAGFAML